MVYHHARKAGADDIFDEFSGTLGLTAVPDHLMIGARSAGDTKQREIHARGRDLPEFAYAVRGDDETKFRFVVLGEITEAKRNALEVAIEKVLQENGETMGVAEIHGALPMRATRDSVKATLSRMYKANKIGKRGKDAYHAAGSDGGKVWPDAVTPMEDLKANGTWQKVTVEGVWEADGVEKTSKDGGAFMRMWLQGDGQRPVNPNQEDTSGVEVLWKDEAYFPTIRKGVRAVVQGLYVKNDVDGRMVLGKRILGFEGADGDLHEEPF